jgi:hypothetical protein
MQRIPSLLVSISLLMGLAPLQALRQDPRAGRAQKPSPEKAALLAKKKTIAQMQGAWQLVHMKFADSNVEGLGTLSMEQAGFCLVSGNHLAIELHVRGVEKGNEDKGRSFVTGMHRFELDEEGGMETTSIIGTRLGIDGLPEFEAPGATRRYDVDLRGETMTLTREDGHTLSFERLRDDPTRYDFFGNPMSEKDEASGGDGDKKKDDDEDGDHR